MNAISLFSGAMGLDLGIEKAGFNIRVCVEMDKWAVETIRANTKIPVLDRDINAISSEEILAMAGLRSDEVTLVVGGPPCQSDKHKENLKLVCLFTRKILSLSPNNRL